MDLERIAAMRVEYESVGLDEEGVLADPFAQFDQWFDDALEAGLDQPNTFVVATADLSGAPSARAVLMKGFSSEGLVFYTNTRSRKGRDLAVNPRAAACFVWQGLHRQVRLEGVVERMPDAAADAYFASRPSGSRLAAAMSPQSEVVDGRRWLEERYAALAAAHPQGDVDRPEEWGGYRIVPDLFEFWQGRPHRLHDRIRFRLSDGGWVIERLAP